MHVGYGRSTRDASCRGIQRLLEPEEARGGGLGAGGTGPLVGIDSAESVGADEVGHGIGGGAGGEGRGQGGGR
jgi:hypothetical protein